MGSGINLDGSQILGRDEHVRGFSTEALNDAVLGRSPYRSNCIEPRFQRTHVNLLRMLVVHTSKACIARDIRRPG